MKTYDRAQVLHVAAQLYSFFAATEPRSDGSFDDPCVAAVETAMELIDEVERQCPTPGKPEATPEKVGRCGMRWHSDDCGCNGEGGDR